jgi:hypothetical protein
MTTLLVLFRARSFSLDARLLGAEEVDAEAGAEARAASRLPVVDKEESSVSPACEDVPVWSSTLVCSSGVWEKAREMRLSGSAE